MIDCLFSSNTATGNGGALLLDGSPALGEIIGCEFRDNASLAGGGAIRYGAIRTVIANCWFHENSAATAGGAVSVGGDFFPQLAIINCTLVQNDSVGGAGLFVGPNASVECYNTIIRENTAGSDIVNDGTLIAEYSCVPPEFPGEGNVHPLDVGFECPGFQQLLVRSPCIDAGRNMNAIDAGLTLDLAGNSRFIDVPAVDDSGEGTSPIVDIGCYEHVPQGAARRYVDIDAPGGGDGLSWATAYNDLRDALDEAECGNVKHVWVAEGTYTADGGNGDRDASFEMKTGVRILGGFDGTETDPDQRDWILNETILSGEIGLSNDLTDNSRHVVRATRVYDGILNGFFIERGYAELTGGAGIRAGQIGSRPIFNNCTVRLNTGVGTDGAGAFIRGGARFINSRFVQNASDGRGGAIYLQNASGEGLDMWGCIVNGNSADEGGGLAIDDAGKAAVINCTFHANIATVGSGGGAVVFGNGSPLLIVANAIFRNNEGTSGTTLDQQITEGTGGTASANYSDLEGWDGSLGGTGNIGLDPLFEDADGPDNILGTSDDKLSITCLSPCLDAGDNASVPSGLNDDGHGDPRILNGTVDMGFDEFAGPFPETAAIVDATIQSGTYISGTIDELLASDDSYVNARSGFGFGISDLHRMEMVVDAVTLVAAPDRIVLKIEHRNTDRPGLGRLYAWNRTTGVWDVKLTVVLGDVDQINVSAPFAAANYVDGGGEIRIMVKHNTFVPFLGYQFQSFIDHLEILVVPDC